MAIKDINRIPTLAAEIRKLKGLRIQVGPINSAEVKKYAHVHEYGMTIEVSDKFRKFVFAMGFHIGKTITIKERSYIRSSFDDKDTMKRILHEANAEINALFNGESSAKEVANRMGDTMKDIIQEKIASGIPPANHPLTEALKGHGGTLLDSGALFESIGYRVK